MSEFSEAVDLLRFETDFEASHYADEECDDPEQLESINARITVLKYLKKLERVAMLAGLVHQDLDHNKMHQILGESGWNKMEAVFGRCWHHPVHWPYPDNRPIGTASACIMELEIALNALQINGG